MTFLIEKLKFLGLNDNEVRVFTALATFGRMNMTKTAARAGLPRTTVDAIVRRLVEQGIVASERVGGHNEYCIHADDLADTLDWIEKRFRPNSGAFYNEYDDGEEKVDPVEGIKNDEKIVIEQKNLEKLREFAKEYVGDRVKMLLSRGHTSIEECLERFIKYTEVAIDNALRFEMMLSYEIADALHGVRDRVPLPEKSELVRLNVVPARYSDSVHDLFIFRDKIYLLHVDNGKRESIVHSTVVETNKHLIEIASETGWSVDLTTWLNRPAH